MPEQPADNGPEFDRDSVGNTLFVAIGLSLVCSILVAGVAILLKPVQEQNEVRFRQRIIMEVAGLNGTEADFETRLSQIEARVIDLDSGQYVDDIDPEDFDAKAAANDPDMGIAIPADLDIGKIRRRANYSLVYLVRDGDAIAQVILPVHGTGLWSTLYGYLALEPDGVTVRGLQFYDHAETPGLGDQFDKPDWRAQWAGKRIYDSDGNPRIEIVRGLVDPDSDDAIHQVDGLSGATLTSRGIMNLVNYWTGPHGFGPYLERFSQQTGD